MLGGGPKCNHRGVSDAETDPGPTSKTQINVLKLGVGLRSKGSEMYSRGVPPPTATPPLGHHRVSHAWPDLEDTSLASVGSWTEFISEKDLDLGMGFISASCFPSEAACDMCTRLIALPA